MNAKEMEEYVNKLNLSVCKQAHDQFDADMPRQDFDMFQSWANSGLELGKLAESIWRKDPNMPWQSLLLGLMVVRYLRSL